MQPSAPRTHFDFSNKEVSNSPPHNKKLICTEKFWGKTRNALGVNASFRSFMSLQRKDNFNYTNLNKNAYILTKIKIRGHAYTCKPLCMKYMKIIRPISRKI